MPALEEALDALAAVARRLGLDAHEARREGVLLSATVAEPAAPTYLAARDWARATGMAAADDIAAANEAFIGSASAGRRWRGSPTSLVAHLRATGADAAAYADALTRVVEAASTLGTTNTQVAANIARATAAQRGAAALARPLAPDDSAGRSSPEAPRYDPSLSPLQDPLVRESLRLLRGLGDPTRPIQTPLDGVPVDPPPLDGGPLEGEPGADPAARHTDSAAVAAATPAVAVPETPDEPVRSVEELLADLDEMIGLDGVKREVHQQVAMLKVVQKREAAGMRNPDVTRHLVFVGNPGTGKTTVARMVSGIYKAMKLLGKGHLVEVDRSELVAGYLGQTAIKTAEVCASAEGGVLFIDEAYSLGGDQYGTEAINTLVKEMEDRRDTLVVIVAGYPEPMVSFITQNPGLASRFKTTIEFADYTDDEIVEILEKLAGAADYDVPPAARDVFREILEATGRSQVFGNGRFARNLLEEAIGRHAWRLQDVEDPTTGQLRELLAEDFRPAPDTDGDSAEDAPEDSLSGGDARAPGTTSDPEAFREDDPGSATDTPASAATHGGGPA